MEQRRYLAAVLTMAATFALVSHGLQSGRVDRWLQHKPDLASELKCATSAVGAKLLSMVSPSLHPGDRDAARLLALLNIFGVDARPQVKPQPVAEPVAVQAQVVAAKVDCPDMLKAQEKALRSAERMQHTMERMQAKLERAQSKLERAQSRLAFAPNAENVNWEIPSAADLNRQIEASMKAAQNRLTAQAMQAQVAAQALANAQAVMANLNAQNVSWSAVDEQGAELPQLPQVNTVQIQRQYNRATQKKMITHTEQRKTYTTRDTSHHL